MLVIETLKQARLIVIGFYLLLATACGDNQSPSSQLPIQAPDQDELLAKTRIVSLAPHITELLFQLEADAHIVATVERSDWPPAAQQLPTIGNAFKINREAVAALEPTHLVAWQEGNSAAMLASLTSLNTPIIVIPTGNLSNLPIGWKTLAKLVDKQTVVEQLTKRYQKKLKQLATPVTDVSPTVTLLLSTQPHYVVGGTGLLAEAITHCGANNTYQQTDLAAIPVSLEQLLADQATTNLLLLGTEIPTAQVRQLRDQLSIPVIQLASPHLYRPTPSIIEGVSELCLTIHQKSD